MSTLSDMLFAIFPPVCGFSFHSLHSVLPRAEVYNIDEELFA